jgi:hypothetical protein
VRTRNEIVERAFTHLGHREERENDSLIIRAWLRRCGVTSPAPWCAAFASWCVEEYLPARVGPVSPQAVTEAGAWKLGRLFPETREPQPADIMYFRTNPKGWQAHCGVVVAVRDFEALCVEGNSRNRVRLVRRRRSDVMFGRTRPERWELSMEGDPMHWVDAPLVRVELEGTR